MQLIICCNLCILQKNPPPAAIAVALVKIIQLLFIFAAQCIRETLNKEGPAVYIIVLCSKSISTLHVAQLHSTERHTVRSQVLHSSLVFMT